MFLESVHQTFIKFLLEYKSIKNLSKFHWLKVDIRKLLHFPYGSFSFLLKNYENLLISKNMHKRDKINLFDQSSRLYSWFIL